MLTTDGRGRLFLSSFLYFAYGCNLTPSLRLNSQQGAPDHPIHMLVSAPAGEEGGGAGGGGASQVSRAAINGRFFPLRHSRPAPFSLPPPSPPRRCSRSVLQDDLDEAGHVGVFGLVGGEEGMLLEDGAAEKQRRLQFERALWCSLMAITKALTALSHSYLLHSP